MAVYGVSPYTLPPEVALGCMMNLRVANAWKTIPQITAIGIAFGNKAMSRELHEMISGRQLEHSTNASDLIEYLKSKEDAR